MINMDAGSVVDQWKYLPHYLKLSYISSNSFKIYLKNL